MDADVCDAGRRTDVKTFSVWPSPSISTASGFRFRLSADVSLHSSNSKMRILRSLALLAGIAATATDAVSVGDAIPSNIDLHFGFPPEMINVGERVAKKKVIIVGLPGAFTPT